MAFSDFIAPVSSFLGGLFTNMSNASVSERAFEKQADFSRWLLRNQTQERVKDMRKAGLNPAFMNGSQLGSGVSTPSYTPPQYSNPLDMTSAVVLGKTIADTRKANADAKAQELLNADKEAKNSTLNDNYDSVWVYEGKEISNDRANELLKQGILPDIMQIKNVRMNDGSEGRFEGHKAIERWNTEVSNMNVQKLHNQLETMVTNGQISSPDVVKALINMPYKQFRELEERVENIVTQRDNLKKQGEILDIQKVTDQLEQDIMRDNNINQYIEKMFEGNFEIKDLCKVLVMAFLGAVTGANGVTGAYKNIKTANK